MGVPSKKTTELLAGAEDEAAADKSRPILLVTPQGGAFADVVEAGLIGHGWRVERVAGAADAFDVLRRQDVALLILDADFPDAQGLLRQAKIDPATSALPVVALFPRGLAPLRPAELRIQAELELIEPFDVQHVFAVAERLAARSAARRDAPGREVRFMLPSHRADLDRACDLVALLLRTSGLDEEAQTSFLTAFHEALGNAIQHGNQRDPVKCVQVRYRRGPDAVTVVVRDEGEGFDSAQFLRQARHKDAAQAARDRHNQGGQGGLGILMIARCADRVDYNGKGNVVTLTKFLAPPPSSS